MTPQDDESQAFASGREADAAIRFVLAESDSASAFTMVVAVPGVTPSDAATCPIGTRRASGDRADCPDR